MKIFDEVIAVTDDDAADTTRMLAQQEGLLVGISSGAAMVAAMIVAGRLGPGKKVVIFPDRGDRYLSTGLFRSRYSACEAC